MRYRGLFVGLLIVLTALLAERSVASTTWHPSGSSAVSLERYRSVLGAQAVAGTESGAVERVWRPAGDTGGARLELEVRLEEGVPGTAWFAYDPRFTIEPFDSELGPFTRITTPPGRDSYVTRRADTGSPIAGRAFRATMNLRAAEPFEVAASACRAVLLREVGGTNAVGCFAASISETWARHEIVWRAPSSATSKIVRIELRMPTTWFEVGDVSLEEWTPLGWRDLSPLEPAGLRLAVAIPGEAPIDWPAVIVSPTGSWQTASLLIDDPRLETGADIRVLLRPEPRTVIHVRNVRLSTTNAVSTRPVARPPRGRLWYEHPNLAAHSLAMAGLVTAAVTAQPIAVLASAGAVLGGVALTGSRLAWFVSLAGLTSLAIMAVSRARYRAPIAWSAVVLTLLVLASLLVMSLTGSSIEAVRVLGRGDANEVTRPEIWAFSWNLMLDHPLTGIGEGQFSNQWALRMGELRNVPHHAHNLWLHFGSTYGLPGIVAISWWSLALLFVTYRWLGSTALVVASCALALQLADFTITYANVSMLLLFVVALPSAPRPTAALPHA